jgi:hypothetical protein
MRLASEDELHRTLRVVDHGRKHFKGEDVSRHTLAFDSNSYAEA